MNARIIPLILSILAAGFCQAAEFRTFTDAQGREMDAKITRVSGEDVYIERRDGLSTRVAISIFSQEDQDYIRKWEELNFLKSGVIKVRFSEEESDSNTSSGGGIKETRYEAGYEIIIENTSTRDLKDIHIEYLMLKFGDRVAAKKRSEGKFERQKGKLKLPSLAQREEARLATETFRMLETELEPGWVWAGGEGGKARESKDKLEGIWVKIYSGDTLILEDARPETMMRKEPW